MSEVTLEQLENQLDDARKAQDKLDQFQRLLGNKDFRELIMEEFCTRECARYVGMSTHLGQDEAEKAHALGMAQAAGYFKRWVAVSQQQLQTQVNSIENLQEALDDYRANQDEG